MAFVSGAAAAADVGALYGLDKKVMGVANCRDLGKKDMVYNNALPDIKVNPETFETTADGELLKCEPARELPLAQKYFLF